LLAYRVPVRTGPATDANHFLVRQTISGACMKGHSSMRMSTKLGLTGLLAAMLLAAALSTASARNLEVSAQGILVSWSRLEFQSNVGTVRCPVTLDGSFHSRTIPKTVNLLIGAISEVRIKRESCSGGEALINNATLPWHIQYGGFTGSLPAITTVRLILSRYQFRVTIIGVNCFYGNATDAISGEASLNGGGEVTELRPAAGNVSNIIEGRSPGELFGCPRTGILASGAGDGIVSQLGAWTTRIRVRLI
jgi:hypothetical protein